MENKYITTNSFGQLVSGSKAKYKDETYDVGRIDKKTVELFKNNKFCFTVPVEKVERI